MKAFTRLYLQPKHIIMYAQAIFLPILLVLFFLPYFSRILTQELYSSNIATLSQTQESLDSAFSELDKILVYMAQHDKLSRYHMENSPAEVVSVLKTITATHPLINDIIITSRDNDILHSSTGSVSISDLEAQHFIRDYQSVGLTGSDWLSLMNTVNQPVYWSSLSHQKSPYSNYVYLITPLYQPLQTDGSVSLRTTTLMINQSYIRNVFFSSQTSSDEGMLLLGPNGALLSKQTSSRTDPYVAEICQYINDSPEEFSDGYSQLPGSNIILFLSRSDKSGLTYVRFLSESDAYSSFYSLQTVSCIITLIVMAAGIALVTLQIRKNDTPIYSLADWVHQRQAEGTEVNDALVIFRNALDNAASRNETLTQAADASRQMLAEHLVVDLVSGNYTSESAFRQDCLSLGLAFDKPYFAACIIMVEEDSVGTVHFERVSALIRSNLPQCYQAYLKDMPRANKLILLINSDTGDLSQYKAAMENLKNLLSTQERLTVSMGLGSFYDSYEKVRKSYNESVAALDYRLVYGKNCLITPDIISSNSPAVTADYPYFDLDLLDNALASNSTDAAATALLKIQANIKLKNSNMHIAKFICYDILSILKKHEDAQSQDSPESIPASQIISDLTDWHSIDEFFASTVHWLQTSSNAQQDPVPLAQTGTGAQLLEYTDAHCLSYDFQIKNMAEHFSISPQYMRKLFKIQTGMSISEYVSNKRLEKSIRLLTQTDMSLQDIVAEIGNSDISGFVRFFKQKTGLTPGQYRKAHKQQN